MAVTTQLAVDVQKPTFKIAQKSLLEVEQGLAGVGKMAQITGSQFVSVGEGVLKLAANLDQLSKAENQFADSVAITNQSLLQQDALLQQPLTRPPPDDGAGGGGGRGAGAGLRTVGRVAGRYGGDIGGQFDEAIDAFTAIVDTFKVVPQIAKSASKMGENLLESGGAMAKVASVGADSAAVLPKVTMGFGAMLAIAAPVALAIGAVVVALSLLSSANKEAEENARRAQAAIDAQIDAQVDIEQMLASGNTEEAIKRALSLQDEAAVATEKASRLRSVANKRAITEEQSRTSVIDEFRTTRAEADKKAAEESANAAEEGADTAVAAWEAARDTLSTTGIDIENISRQTMEAEQELGKERERAQTSIANLGEQEADLIAKREQQLQDQAKDRSIRDQREQADAQERAGKHRDRLRQIEKDGTKSLRKIDKDAREKEAELRDKAADDLQSALDESQEARQDALQSFNKEDLDAQQDYYVRLRRLRMDFENAEFDAVLGNNIIAAMQARRGFDERRQEEQDAFRLEKQERDAQKEARLQEIREESVLRMQETSRNLEDELSAHRDATKERIRQEQDAIEARADAERKTQEEAEKQRKKRLKRQAEDDTLRDERAQRAHEESLSQIEKKKKAEQDALNATFAAVEQGTDSTIRGIAESNLTAIKITKKAAVDMVNAIQDAVKRSSQIKGRQHGGRIGADQPYRVNEAGLEGFISDMAPGKVIPLTDRRTRHMGNTSHFTINVPVSASEFATPQDIVTAVQGGLRQFMESDMKAFADALAGV